MSEAWIPVAYALIAALAAGFSAWIGSKKAVAPVGEKVNLVENKVQQVIAQNTKQSNDIGNVQRDLNGRLTEWRAETDKYVKTAVAAAFAEGKAVGAEHEKQVEATAERVLEKAEVVAEKVVEVAKEAAVKVLIEKEKK